jgi:hypothetical protein
LTSLLITRDFARQVIKSRCQDSDDKFDAAHPIGSAGLKFDVYHDLA